MDYFILLLKEFKIHSRTGYARFVDELEIGVFAFIYEPHKRSSKLLRIVLPEAIAGLALAPLVILSKNLKKYSLNFSAFVGKIPGTKFSMRSRRLGQSNIDFLQNKNF